MLQALVNGVLNTPQKKLKGKCQFCGDDMIPKCGSHKMHHWAHRIKECDDWQTGKETEWHINWKKTIGLDFAEKRIIKNDLFHIADILIPNSEGKIDLIVEFQNSPLSQIEIHERETFYGERLIWVINGTQLGEKFFINRHYGDQYTERWYFEPTIDFYMADNKTGVIEKGYVINVYEFSKYKDYQPFLFKEGYKRNPDSKKIVEMKSYLGFKDKGDISTIYYYKPTSDLSYDKFKDYHGQFILRRDIAFDKLRAENQNKISQQDIIEGVRFKWKYARKDFNISKRPIYLDLNDTHIFKLENGRVEEGYGGKLIKKAHFIDQIKKRAKNSQLSLKI